MNGTSKAPGQPGRSQWIVGGLLVVLLGGGTVAGWTGLGSPDLPERPKFHVDVAALDALAGTDGLPVAIDALVVGEATLPAFISTARTSFAGEPRIYPAWIVRYADRHIVLDAPHDRERHKALFGAEAAYHDRAWEILQELLGSAEAIYVTHTHGDHVLGIARSPHLASGLPFRPNHAQHAVLAAADTTPGTQRSVRDVTFPAAAAARLETLPDLPVQHLAPGLVAIRTPGHTPGHQAFWIRTVERSYLLVGDIVWSRRNLDDEKGRPRLVSRYIVGEDMQAVTDQLAGLIQLRERGGVEILISKDAAWLEEQQARGVVGDAASPD